MSTAQQRTKMVGENWDVFTKRVLVEKLINDIMFEILGGGDDPPDPRCRRP